MPDSPLAYFITVHTYGTWLPGNEKGWAHPTQDRHGAPVLAHHPLVKRRAQDRMSGEPFTLNQGARGLILRQILEVHLHRQWRLHVAHVRATHWHVILTASVSPERAMNDLKAWGTRRLDDAGIDHGEHSPWSRHGSTRWLWTEEQFVRELKYVVLEQGNVLSGDCLYVDEYWKPRAFPNTIWPPSQPRPRQNREA